MMKLKASKYTKRGETFAVVLVDKPIIEDKEKALHIVRNFQKIFTNMHIVLWYWKPGEQSLFFGRPDVAKRLSGVAVASIPWEEYEIEDYKPLH